MSQDVCLGRTSKPTEISWTRELRRQLEAVGHSRRRSCAVWQQHDVGNISTSGAWTATPGGLAGERSLCVDGEGQKDGRLSSAV